MRSIEELQKGGEMTEAEFGALLKAKPDCVLAFSRLRFENAKGEEVEGDGMVHVTTKEHMEGHRRMMEHFEAEVERIVKEMLPKRMAELAESLKRKGR
jgi:hypothetical protein